MEKGRTRGCFPDTGLQGWEWMGQMPEEEAPRRRGQGMSWSQKQTQIRRGGGEPRPRAGARLRRGQAPRGLPRTTCRQPQHLSDPCQPPTCLLLLSQWQAVGRGPGGASQDLGPVNLGLGGMAREQTLRTDGPAGGAVLKSEFLILILSHGAQVPHAVLARIQEDLSCTPEWAGLGGLRGSPRRTRASNPLPSEAPLARTVIQPAGVGETEHQGLTARRQLAIPVPRVVVMLEAGAWVPGDQGGPAHTRSLQHVFERGRQDTASAFWFLNGLVPILVQRL